MRSRRNIRRQAGFTLIEMIVAAFVLAIGVSAVLMCISGATRSTGAAADYATAAMLAQKHIAELEIDPTQISGGGGSGSFAPMYPQFTWDQSVDTTTYANLVQVTLNVSWGLGRSRHTAQFVTFEPTVAPNYGTAATGTGTGTGGAGG